MIDPATRLRPVSAFSERKKFFAQAALKAMDNIPSESPTKVIAETKMISCNSRER